MSTLQAAVESLRADIDMILQARVPESEAPSTKPAKDTVLAALFSTSEILSPPPRNHANYHRGREENEATTRKKCCKMEAARRASIADEEVRKIRDVESAAGASSSRYVETPRGNTNSVVSDEDTSEGVQTTKVVGSREPDPQAC